MATTITFTHNDKDYTLEYTRATVKKLFDLGFHFKLLDENPIKAVELLGYGAFLANHKFIKQQDAIDIICSLSDGESDEGSIVSAFLDMINEAMDETVLKKKGNVKWQVNK